MSSQSLIVAMRGRNPDNPGLRVKGCHLEQRLEPNSQHICNTLTSVQKDNCVLTLGDIVTLRYLTPDEEGRLQGLDDERLKLLSACQSDRQLYKQYGNSIDVKALMAAYGAVGFKKKAIK